MIADSHIPDDRSGAASTDLLPVLEIGGTHLTAALVDRAQWAIVPGSTTRRTFDTTGSAETLLGMMADAAAGVPDGHGDHWAVAIPGPFDYESGIGRFEHVGKFDNLNGVDVRERLAKLIDPRPASIRFLNDADAFGVGEYAIGAARGAGRAVCITLGTGIGSAFLTDGEPVNAGPSVPPDGSVHLLQYDGRPLEETVSRRAIRARYCAAAGIRAEEAPDVHEIAARGRSGDQRAGRVLHEAFADLGSALAPTMERFGADLVVIGGSISQSWDIVEPALREGMVRMEPRLGSLALRQAESPDEAPVIGAAFWASRQ